MDVTLQAEALAIQQILNQTEVQLEAAQKVGQQARTELHVMKVTINLSAVVQAGCWRLLATSDACAVAAMLLLHGHSYQTRDAWPIVWCGHCRPSGPLLFGPTSKQSSLACSRPPAP